MNSNEHIARCAAVRWILVLRMPVRIDGHDLAGLDLAEEGRADDVERAGLARDDVPGAAGRIDVAETAEAQRADAERIARGDE